MSMEQRVEQLERRIRRHRFGMLAMGLGLGAAVFLGMVQKAPTEMTLEQLIITKDGKARIFIGTDPENGGVGFSVMDPGGKDRISFGSDPLTGEYGFALVDDKGKARIAAGTNPQTGAGIAIMDKNETPRIVLGDGLEGAGVMLIGAGMTEVPMPQQPGKK
ncbi:MAG: hypothetical protein MK116_07180 [Phycisphaerales bacterium]|nr:hypothetical protein [Phycisphaerales bacterium]